ncbi:tail protein X [Paraburkholderia sp. BL23I1N1]|uniref:tail protein X n=1 Tax=Paraburkholderia sp. BL23I1N1 TaxID=1938802 RepID=UPI000FF5B6FE|nr:tail protein X [Paraburkholderia sp. BL23I1N1]RKE24372.1 tail protein X [Paraburkholderia sp. BL23I1N1]
MPAIAAYLVAHEVEQLDVGSKSDDLNQLADLDANGVNSREVCESGYEANPGLAARTQPFAAGIIIALPDLNVQRDEPVQLWT